MKRLVLKSIIVLSGLFFFLSELSSQSLTQNYNLTRTMTSADGTKYQDIIQYFDGLGRPTQTVQRGVTPLKKDLVSLQEYDTYGRPLNQWLPGYGSGDGNYTEASILKTAAISLNAGDTYPYSKLIYESSPLDRVLQEFGPGMSWHQNNKSSKKDYLTNSSLYPCIHYTLVEDKIINSGVFADAELHVLKMTDEDGSQSFEFKNKLGQVLLLRQLNSGDSYDTYYIYDNQGNLKCVLPPKLVDKLMEVKSYPITNIDIYQLAFLYKYDKKSRCVGKKLPGADWVYYVYDKNNCLIFSQDGEQRLNNEWFFTFPDSLGRTVLTGICSNVKRRNVELAISTSNFENEILQAIYKDASIYNRYKVMLTADSLILNSVKHYTTNYYDTYSYQNRNINFSSLYYSALNGSDAGFDTRFTTGDAPAKGLLTGTIVGDADTGTTNLYSAIYYDSRGRIVQNRSTNHLGGAETEYFIYNFMNNPVKRMRVHKKNGVTAETKELYEYKYDHAGRLDTCKHKLGEGAFVVLAANSYDELGRLKTNKKASLPVSTYTYNIRSWMKSIVGTLFAQTLYYNDSYAGNTACYNGNITAMSWKVGSETLRGYTFTYDNFSRLVKADYLLNGVANDSYKVPLIAYDKHGNIISLERWGKTSTNSTYGMVDKLSMTYAGNQLTKATDAGISVSMNESGDFKAYQIENENYKYNRNGALVKDSNKGIMGISYNSLNLPRQLDITNAKGNGQNLYTYLSDGRKIKVVQKTGSSLTTTKTTDYVGNHIYENGVLKCTLVDGGYIEGGTYYFYLTDHLGNSRVVADMNGNVIQKNHYYPFGMTFAETSSTEQDRQPYKYGGKELDRLDGLNWYDYSARQYEPALGRFTTMDPLAEKYYSISPYAYCFNNPVRYIDPTGMVPEGDLAKSEPKGLREYVNLFFSWLSYEIGMHPRQRSSEDRAVQEDAKRRLDKAIEAVNAVNETALSFVPGGEIGYNYLTNQEIEVEDFAWEAAALLPFVKYGKTAVRGAAIWTKTGKFSAVENALTHWNKHRNEFPEFQNAKQYVEGATDFLHNSPSGTLVKTRPNGDVLKYYPKTNTFGVMDASGTPRTVFRPTNGMKYWLNQ